METAPSRRRISVSASAHRSRAGPATVANVGVDDLTIPTTIMSLACERPAADRSASPGT